MSHLDLMPARSPALGRAIEADTLLRSVLLAAVFLLLWISLHPFVSHSAIPTNLTEAGSVANQIAYSLLLIVLAAWCLAHDPGRLLVSAAAGFCRNVALVRPHRRDLLGTRALRPPAYGFTLITMSPRRHGAVAADKIVSGTSPA